MSRHNEAYQGVPADPPRAEIKLMVARFARIAVD
jgi:hypothetical protein